MFNSIHSKRLLIFLVPILFSLPFINRAFFVDDSFFVHIASWIADHPSRPYDFPEESGQAGDSIHGEQKLVRILNPLLHHYYLALLIKIGGIREWFLREGNVWLASLCLLMVFELARRWTQHPLLATLMCYFTPAYFLTSYSLLIDGTLVLFVLAGIYFYVRMIEDNSLLFSVLSGVLMGLGLLTKYTGVLAIPVTGLWFLLNIDLIKKKWMGVLPWALASIMLATSSFYIRSHYGADHLGSSMALVLHHPSGVRFFVFLVFLSGVSLVPILAWFGASRNILIRVGLVVLVVTVFLSSELGGFHVMSAFLLALWSVSSLFLIMLFIGARKSWTPPSDLFLLGWVLLFTVMMAIVMPWVAARYYLVGLIPWVFMAVRIIELRQPVRANKIFTYSLILMGVITAIVAYADYQQAESSRFIEKSLRNYQPSHGGRRYFLGDSYSMHYLENSEWHPLRADIVLEQGDLIVVPGISLPQNWIRRTRKEPMKVIDQIENPSHFPLKVMDYREGAAFYASVWGPLPFAFSTNPWERFSIFEVMSSNAP